MNDLNRRLEIPPEVLQAHEDGDLILFCGAGVSAAAKLPLFDGLAKRVQEELHIASNSALTAAWDAKAYDRFLHLLEAEQNGPQLRKAVCQILSTKPERLDVHESIVTLARMDHGIGRLRLVTTNFDTIFEQAELRTGRRLSVEAAPRLAPIDAERWDSIVYLHGRIEWPENDDDSTVRADGRDLVLTSADFGRAYLREGWASRFVTELFEKYTVLFIGYGVNDPVMRYMIDAFASRPGSLAAANAKGFFALAEKENEDADWKSKGIVPVHFSSGNDYAELYQGLAGWANDYRDGTKGKRYRLRQILERGRPPLKPEHRDELRWILSAQKAEVFKALYAVDVESAAPVAASEASPVSKRQKLVSAIWLDELFELKLLSDENLFAQAYRPTDELKSKERPRSAPLAAHRRFGGSDISLGERTRQIAIWLSHLATDTEWVGDSSNSATLLEWVVERGGALHPDLAWGVRAQLRQDAPMDEQHRRVWNIVVDERFNLALQRPYNDMDVIKLNDQLKAGDSSGALGRRLVHAVEPLLALSASNARTTRELLRIAMRVPQSEAPHSIHHIIDIGIELRFGSHADTIERALATCSTRDSLLAEVAFPITENLAAVLAARSQVAQSTDHAELLESRELPSIEGIDRGRRYRAWTLLVDLLWSAGLVLDSGDESMRRLAIALFERWLAIPHVTFRRLALKAAANWTSLDASARGRALFNE